MEFGITSQVTYETWATTKNAVVRFTKPALKDIPTTKFKTEKKWAPAAEPLRRSWAKHGKEEWDFVEEKQH